MTVEMIADIMKFDRCNWLGTIHAVFWNDLQRSLKVIEVGTNLKPICDFLLVFHCNYMPIFYRFWDITIYWLKICVFLAVLPTQYRLQPPPQSCSPQIKGIKVVIKQLESMGYLTVKTAWFHDHLSPLSIGLYYEQTQIFKKNRPLSMNLSV